MNHPNKPAVKKEMGTGKESPKGKAGVAPLPGTPKPIYRVPPLGTSSEKKSRSEKHWAFPAHTGRVEDEDSCSDCDGIDYGKPSAFREKDIEAAKQAVADLASVPIGSVALIAATLSEPGLRADECIVKAYEILEWATFGQRWLGKQGGEHAISTGIVGAIERQTPARFVVQDEKTLKEEERRMKCHALIYDEDGNYRAVPFHEALAAIIPRPGTKYEGRVSLFTKWLMAYYEIDEAIAFRHVTKWKEDGEGVPPKVVSNAFQTYDGWRIWDKSEKAKVGNAASQEAKAKKAEAEKQGAGNAEAKPKKRKTSRRGKARGGTRNGEEFHKEEVSVHTPKEQYRE